MPAANFKTWLRANKKSRPGFRRTRRTSQIPSVLSVGSLSVVYQPIVSVADKAVFAYEALVRSDSPHFQSPPELFTEAVRSQCCGALGRIIRELATTGCPDYPLFLNLHPNEFDEAWLVQPDDPIFQHYHPIYLEITESVPLTHFALCHSVLQELRGKGIFLAVDDLGAGYSNLKYISDLAPEIVKLDRGLIANIDRNERQQILVRNIVKLCSDLGARVVGEGVETQDELRALVDAGCHFLQGYFLARPASPPPRVQFPSLRV